MIGIESQIICYTPNLSVIINKRSESAVLCKIRIKICMLVVALGRRSHLAPKGPQSMQIVCLHNLSYPLDLQSFQVASTFVDIMVAAKKRDLEVGSKNFSYLTIVEGIEIKDTRREER